MKVSLRIYTIAGWFLFLFFGASAVYALSSHQYVLALLLAIVSSGGVFWIMFFGDIEMDETLLRHKTLSGTYEIRWDEITHIEHRETSSHFVFYGNGDKILSISGPSTWPSRDAEEGLYYLAACIEKYEIPITEGQRSFRFPRNTKVDDG